MIVLRLRALGLESSRNTEVILMQTVLFSLVLVAAGQLEGGNRYQFDVVPADESGGAARETTPRESSPAASADAGESEPRPFGARADEGLTDRRESSPATTLPPSRDYGGTPLGQPRSSASPASGSASAGVRPADLVRELYAAPKAAGLDGIPLSLADAVRGADSRSEQTRRVLAYWDLSTAMADYYLAVREGVEMAALRNGVARPGAEWNAALGKLKTRSQAAKRSAQAAQFQMMRLLGRSGESTLPLASDLPHGGRYETRYEEIFAGRRARPAESLNDMLALRHDELRTQAADEAEARNWLEHVSRTRNPNTGGEGLLRAYDLLSLKRRAFLFTLRDYNQKIAAYAELASPGQIEVPRLVAMHIKSDEANWEKPNVRRAAAIQAEKGRPRTFADEGRRSVRRPSASPSRERSVIVKKPAARGK